jgi:Lipid A 3-O-deacylase (PagL)
LPDLFLSYSRSASDGMGRCTPARPTIRSLRRRGVEVKTVVLLVQEVRGLPLGSGTGDEHEVQLLKKPFPRHLSLLIVTLGIVGVSLPTRAAEEPSPTDAAGASPTQSAPASRWTYDFESSYTFRIIQNPFWLLAGQRGEANNPKNIWHYRLNSYLFGGRYDLTKVGGWGFLRGYWQSSGADILEGPEHYYGGLIGGLRYLFVPGDGTWAPYAEFREGVGATDASHRFYGQQADLSFMYLLGFGVRCQPDPRWRVSLGIVDQHMSNGYLTKENFGFDSVGFNVAVEWRP